MNQMAIQNSFFVCYAKADEPLVHTVIEEINGVLETNYVLWSYNLIGDPVTYFEKVAQPAIERADFVLFILTKAIEKDEMAQNVYSYCRNLNKSIIPLKVVRGRLRLRSFVFRTEIADFDDKQDKVKFLEQMHSWLGLVKVYPWSSVKFCSRCGKKIKTNAAFCKWCGKKFNH